VLLLFKIKKIFMEIKRRTFQIILVVLPSIKGIINRTICLHTSKQNGIAERKYIHIVENGLKLLAQASSPLKFWLNAFTTTIYLKKYQPKYKKIKFQ